MIIKPERTMKWTWNYRQSDSQHNCRSKKVFSRDQGKSTMFSLTMGAWPQLGRPRLRFSLWTFLSLDSENFWGDLYLLTWHMGTCEGSLLVTCLVPWYGNLSLSPLSGHLSVSLMGSLVWSASNLVSDCAIDSNSTKSWPLLCFPPTLHVNFCKCVYTHGGMEAQKLG